MQPDIWGKYLWISIHYIALGYPSIPSTDDIIAYTNFFNDLIAVIPCPMCADHYQRMLRKLPLTDDVLATNETLFKWTVDIHNLVNRETNKNEIAYKDAFAFYTETLPKHNKSVKDVFEGMVDTPVYLSNTLTRRMLIVLNLIILLTVGLMLWSKTSSRRPV